MTRDTAKKKTHTLMAILLVLGAALIDNKNGKFNAFGRVKSILKRTSMKSGDPSSPKNNFVILYKHENEISSD